MTQFKVKMGKIPLKFKHELFRHIPEINTFYVVVESRTVREMSYISTVGWLGSCQKLYD